MTAELINQTFSTLKSVIEAACNFEGCFHLCLVFRPCELSPGAFPTSVQFICAGEKQQLNLSADQNEWSQLNYSALQ